MSNLLATQPILRPVHDFKLKRDHNFHNGHNGHSCHNCHNFLATKPMVIDVKVVRENPIELILILSSFVDASSPENSLQIT